MSDGKTRDVSDEADCNGELDDVIIAASVLKSAGGLEDGEIIVVSESLSEDSSETPMELLGRVT